MGSNEAATATTGAPKKMTFLTGSGAPSGPNYLLFVVADRLAYALWDRSGVGWSPRPHAPVLGALQRALDSKLWGLVLEGPGGAMHLAYMYPLMEAATHAA